MKSGLEVQGLCKSYGGLHVSKDINFSLNPGDRKALIGPNGAGKSTFANLITGIVQPSAGVVYLDGKDIASFDEAARVKAGIGKTFQTTNLFPSLTVRENLRLPVLEREGMGTRLFSRADRFKSLEIEIESLLIGLNLLGVADSAVGDLAYGQQRLVELALALALKPVILILDEPAAGVPSGDSQLIIDAINRLPKDLAVLIIEHDMDLVFTVATSIIVLVMGEVLIEGTPEQIASDPQVRELYLGQAYE